MELRSIWRYLSSERLPTQFGTRNHPNALRRRDIGPRPTASTPGLPQFKKCVGGEKHATVWTALLSRSTGSVDVEVRDHLV